MAHRVRLIWLAVLGVLVALGPMLVVEPAIRWVALTQGQARLGEMADHMLAHADDVLESASGALAALARSGVATCSPTSVEDISETVQLRPLLKEIGIYDARGRILCTNFGPSLLGFAPGAEIKAAEAGLAAGLLPTPLAGHKALGLARAGAAGGGLIAIVEPKTLLVDPLNGDLAESGHARIELADGAPVIRSGRTLAAVGGDDPGFFEARRVSTRFPVVAAVAAPRAALMAPFAALGGLAKIGGGVIGVALLAFVGLALRRRPTMAADIDAAIRGREFVPFYQPIVDSTDGRVAGCEVLLRWRKPGGELVPPDQFIPFAEASGQIIEITRGVMARVRDDLAEVCQADADFEVSINLAADHFASSAVVGDVRRCFGKGPVRPHNLILEITERRPLGDMAAARQTVDGLKALGVRVALDDAGTGHGGLASIQYLGLDVLKIDRMFVEAIGTDAAKAPIVDAMIEIARQFGMKVVAEGVETEEQFAYLVRRGTRFHQGFLFGRPMPARAFARFVAAFRPGPAADFSVPSGEVGIAA